MIKHRYEIMPQGVQRFYYINRVTSTISIIYKPHELNVETSLEYILCYDDNHRNLGGKIDSGEYKVDLYIQTEQDAYYREIHFTEVYVDKGNNIHFIK